MRHNGKTTFDIQGVNNAEKVEQDFIGTLRSNSKFNTVIQVKACRFDFDGKTVLAFYVPSSTFKPVYYNTPANTFIRTGSGDHRVTDFEFGMLLREQEFGCRSEKSVQGTSFADIFPSSLDTYRNILRHENTAHSYPGLSDEDFCKKIGIMNSDGELIVGGLLMFGKRDSIRKITQNFWIDYIEIPGTSVSDAVTRYTFRLQEQENIWESYNIIFQRLRNFVDNPYSPREDGFAPDDESRLYCLREALVNLCAHSDYFAPAHPTIRVYSNRISFQNPGVFTFDVSKIKTQPVISQPRNPSIIRFFRYAKLSENAGYGIEKILKWSELTGEEVNFDTYSMVSDVVFNLSQKSGGVNGGVSGGVSGGVKLSDREILITNYLIDNPTASQILIGKELNIALRTLERTMAKLQKNNVIERVGSDKSGYWKVNK